VTEWLLEPASTDEQLEKIIDGVQVRCNCQSQFCSRFASRLMLHGSL